MCTNYNEIIPKKVLFSIRDIEEYGIMKSAMMKKLIYKKQIEVTKIASKNFISRQVLISYLEDNTIPVEAN